MSLLSRRRLWTIGGASVVLAVVAVGLLHTPPVRRRVLSAIVSELARAGLVANAARIEYNLATLSAHLYDVTLAASSAASEPFFAAKEIHAIAGRNALVGAIDIQSIDIVGARVVLRRDAAGRNNWSIASSGTTPSTAPIPIRIEHARVRDLALSWQDDQTATAVDGAVSIELTPNDNAATGPIAMTRPMRLRWRDRETTIAALDGRLSWNARDLGVDALSLRAREGILRGEGHIESLLGPGRVDVRLTAEADLAAVSRWTNLDRPIAGAARVTAHLAGPLANPAATLAVSGREIVVPSLPPMGLEAALSVSGGIAELTSVRALIADGSVTARGRGSLDGPGTVRLEWERVALPALLRSALDGRPRVVAATRLSGSLDARWTAPHIDHLVLTSQTRAVSSVAGDRVDSAATGGATRGGQASLPLAGMVKLDLRGRDWTLSASDLVTDGARAAATLSGVLSTRAIGESSLTGTIRVATDDAGRLSQALARSRLIGGGPPLRGTATSELRVTGTLGAPSVDGPIDATVQYQSLPPATVHTVASIAAGAVRLDEIDARLADGWARGAVQWSARSNAIAGRLDASATLSLLADLSGALPPSVPANGAVNLSAALSGSLADPRATVTASGNALDLAGQHVDRLAGDITVRGANVTVDRLLVESGTGRLDARGTFATTRQTYAAEATIQDYPIRPVAGVVRADGADDRPPLPISGQVTGTFEGAGSFQNLGGRGRLSIADARWDTADLGRITAGVTLAGRAASLAIDAPDLALSGNGTIGLDPAGPLEWRGQWAPADVSAVARRLAVAVPFSAGGSAALRFELAGTRDRLAEARGTVNVEGIDVAIANQPIRLVRAGEVRYDGRTLHASNLALASGTSTLTIDGSIGDAAARGLTLSLDGSLGDFGFAREVISPRPAGTDPLPSPAGSIQLRLTAAGALRQPSIAGSLQIADGALPLTARDRLTSVGVRARYDNGVMVLEEATAAFAGATLVASARVPGTVAVDRLPVAIRRVVPPARGPATLSARILSITPSAAAPFVSPDTLQQVTGVVDATIQLDADRLSLDRLRGTIALDRADVSLAGVSFNQQAMTRLVVGAGRVDIDTWTWGRDDNRVVLRGGATLSDNPALDLVATAALDLRLLNIVSGAVRVTGGADAEVRLGGTVRSPTLDGRVTLRRGEARLADPRLIVSDVNGTILLTGDTLTLDGVSATVNGGDSTLAGSIRHRWLSPLDGRIALQSRGAALDLAGLRAEADADVTLAIDPTGSVVGGSVMLLRSVFQEPLSLTGGLLRALQVSSRATPPALASPLGRMRLDVRVATEDDLIVDNNYGKFTIRGDLRLVGTVARPSVIGRATLGEGGLLFFGANRYRLADQGTIDFANPTYIEPDLDLNAVTRVGDTEITRTEITLGLKGTPATLQTTLTSDDPKYSQSDLVSLLVLGRTTDEAAAGGFTPGSQELLGYLSGELLGAAGRAIGLDTLRVERGTPDAQFDAGLVATETDPGARLTFGRSVGTKTQVIFSQSLQQSGGFTWIVSYAPRSGINLRAISLDAGDRSYNFRHDVIVGGPARPARRTAVPVLRVGDVTVAGAGADEAEARARLKLSPGERFSFFTWQDDRERLERFYHEREYFEARVATHRALEPSDASRVRLVYDIRPGPPTRLVIDGYSFSSPARRRMERAWTRAVVDDFLIEEVAEIARAALADVGFVLATAAAAVEQADGGGKRLRVTVDPGRRAGRRRVAFAGNRHLRSDRLLEALSERDLLRAVWTEPDRARDGLADFYHATGYLNAVVRIDPISLVGGTATRTIHVDEGDPFRIRHVRVDGASVIPADEVTQTLALSPGSAFSELAMERAHLKLDARYRAQGFNGVNIAHEAAAVPDSAEVDIAIHVDEGARQRLREIVTAGVERTNPALVHRALKLDVGAPVDLAAWNKARQRLYETGVFRSVDIQREVIPPPAPGTAAAEEPVRAVVTVQEWPPLRVRYGLELRDELESGSDSARSLAPTSDEVGGRTFGIGVSGDLSARSLFGRAVSAGLGARWTPDARAGRVYATSPAFFGLPVTSNVFVERSREEFASDPETGVKAFRVDDVGWTIEQRVRPFAKTEIAYRYTLKRTHSFTKNPDPNDPLPFDVTVTAGRLASTIAIDRRDDLIDAARGWFHSSSVEYAPPALGRDLRFVKYLVQQRYYRTVGRVVFASSARLGLATAFDQTLIPSERFYAGGGNSVRGYGEDTLSPRNDFGDTVGGNALAVLNQEVRFPIFKWVRGVTFVDAGRAFETVGGLSLRDLSASTGFGLRVQTPIVLLRVDFGIPFDKAAGPRRGRWFFSVGQTF